MVPLTNITYYISYIIQLKFSTKYARHITTKIGPQITLSPHIAQHHLACRQNSKKAQIPKSHYDVANSKSLTMMWLIPNIPLRCGKFKARYNAALFTKTVMMRHYLQSPLLHGTLKLVATWQYFTKSQNHFYKGQILIWHLFSQSPNSYLASIFIKLKF